MESISSEKREVLLDILSQIKESIENLFRWNRDVVDMNNLLLSPEGVQDLAGNCMTIMAIGEGFRKIDKMTEGQFLPLQPQIPWHQVFGLRNRIAHGYSDIDIDIISEVIAHDLRPLHEATSFFITLLRKQS